MSQYGNYIPKVNLIRSCDSSLRLYGMQFKDNQLIKDISFYCIIEKNLGYSYFKLHIAFRNLKRSINKTFKLKFTKIIYKSK